MSVGTVADAVLVLDVEADAVAASVSLKRVEDSS